MTIAFVQSKTGSANNFNSLAATFDIASTAGNLLVAVIGVSSDVTLTPPAGWSLAKTEVNTVEGSIYYRENAPSATTITFSIATSPTSSTIIIAEYSGIATASPLDVTGSNTGSSASPSTGSAGPTNLQNELLIGGLSSNPNGGTNTFSSPTNSFTLRAQIQELGDNLNSIALLDRIVSSVDTYSTGATLSQTAVWCGVIATFKSDIGDTLPGNRLLFSPRATPLVQPGVGNKLLKGP